MFEPEAAAFVEGGRALIIGTVATDGQPHSGRGWGADVLSETRVRLLLDADDTVTIDNVATSGAIAVTATDVPTLRSLQFKGRSVGMEPAGPDDRRRADRYCEAFFNDIIETDGTNRELLNRIVPADFVVCEVEVTERYDQTPGPGAGRRIPETSGG